MASVPAGSYLASDPVFAPAGNGACTPETLARVNVLASQAPWPDRLQEVQAFTIDKERVSCRDYQACVVSGGCPSFDASSACIYSGRAEVTLELAVAYCKWRHAKLPTLLQWQAAVRGPAGKIAAECDTRLNTDDCTVTSDAGVIVHTPVGPSSEFTSTMGCWPGRPGFSEGLHPIEFSPLVKQLNLFVPADPDDDEWFRCARDQAVLSAPSAP